MLQSYGIVQPRTQSMLVSQVGGQIIEVAPQFRDGGFLKAEDVLLQIDPRDYQADVKIAEASLLDARQSLAEEEARAYQARVDWDRLGNEGDAPALVLRTPQRLAAEARVVSAESALTKARLNLERTTIKAPFDGRILSRNVDLGQVVSTNTALAEIYATDYVEIRLPIKNQDLGLVDLPEQNGGSDTAEGSTIGALVYSSLGRKAPWHASIERTEGAIDSNSRQLHVVAQIDDPVGVESSVENPLKIGEYVTAEIEGSLLEEAIVIDNGTIYQGTYVFVVIDEKLMRRPIEILWQNDTQAIIASGLEAGDLLVLTPLGQVTSGTRVRVNNL